MSPALILTVGAVPPAPSWVWFDSVDYSSTTWYNEDHIIDGDTGTYSTGSGPDYSEYVTTSLNVAKTSTQIKIWIENDPMATADALVEIDISPDGEGSWTNIHTGTILNGDNNGWQTIAFSSQTVKALRIKRTTETASYVNGLQIEVV